MVEKQRLFFRLVASEEVKIGSRANWNKDTGGKDSLDRNSAGGGSSIGDSVEESVGSAKKRSITSSARFDDEDSRLMAIVSTSPTEPTLARSYQSSMLMKLSKGGRNALAPTARRSRTLSTFSSNSDRPEDIIKGTTIILEPGRPSLLESRWLAEMTREKDSAVAEKFERSALVVPYHMFIIV